MNCFRNETERGWSFRESCHFLSPGFVWHPTNLFNQKHSFPSTDESLEIVKKKKKMKRNEVSLLGNELVAGHLLACSFMMIKVSWGQRICRLVCEMDRTNGLASSSFWMCAQNVQKNGSPETGAATRVSLTAFTCINSTKGGEGIAMPQSKGYSFCRKQKSIRHNHA